MTNNVLKGIVASDKMDKTRSVLVESFKTHSKYRKKYKVSKKYIVKDESNSTKKGDVVSIVETRPFSKRGRWKIMKVKNSNLKIQNDKSKLKSKV